MVTYDITVKGVDGKPTGIHACTGKATVPENINSGGCDIDGKELHYKPTGARAHPEKDTVGGTLAVKMGM